MGNVASQAGSFLSCSSAIRRSGADPSGPYEGSSSSPARLSSSNRPATLQNVGTSASSSSLATSSMSSVSPILVSEPSSICLRMSAGSTNRSELGAGMRSRASAARLVPSARIGWTVTTASAGWPSRVSIVSMALPSRSARIASSSMATAAAPSTCRVPCEFTCAAPGWVPADVSSMSCAPSRSSGLRPRIVAAFLSCWTMRPS